MNMLGSNRSGGTTTRSTQPTNSNLKLNSLELPNKWEITEESGDLCILYDDSERLRLKINGDTLLQGQLTKDPYGHPLHLPSNSQGAQDGNILIFDESKNEMVFAPNSDGELQANIADIIADIEAQALINDELKNDITATHQDLDQKYQNITDHNSAQILDLETDFTNYKFQAELNDTKHTEDINQATQDIETLQTDLNQLMNVVSDLTGVTFPIEENHIVYTEGTGNTIGYSGKYYEKMGLMYNINSSFVLLENETYKYYYNTELRAGFFRNQFTNNWYLVIGVDEVGGEQPFTAVVASELWGTNPNYPENSGDLFVGTIQHV